MGVAGFEGRVAVVTGGGSGMGRELVRQLAVKGCHVATCDLDGDRVAEAAAKAQAEAPDGVRVTSHSVDVADADAMGEFASRVESDHGPALNLLFNNAGIAGGASFLDDPVESWERVFAIDWGGVYNGTRAFMPMLRAAAEGHVVNTSSVHGFWATWGPNTPNSAYATAKFAVKGFTEALMADFAVYAPHLSASVVMPGHIGTDIVNHTAALIEGLDESTPDEEIERHRARLIARGLPVADLPVDALRKGMIGFGQRFRDSAPTTAAQAAEVILDGVLAGEWRILVGEDAHVLDMAVRDDPTAAYTADFLARLQAQGHFGAM